MAAKKKPKVCFETGLKELEALVARMQSGDIPLDEAMKLYEEGISLAGQLEEILNSHQKRIEMLDPDTAEITMFEENENGLS